MSDDAVKSLNLRLEYRHVKGRRTPSQTMLKSKEQTDGLARDWFEESEGRGVSTGVSRDPQGQVRSRLAVHESLLRIH